MTNETKLELGIGAVALVAIAYIVYKLSRGAAAVAAAIPTPDKVIESAKVIRTGTVDAALSFLGFGRDESDYMTEADFRAMSAAELAKRRAKK